MAREFARIIDSRAAEIVEIGCGEGQLTIPLAKLIPSGKIVTVDDFRGPYRGSMERIKAALRNGGLVNRVKVVASNCWRWFDNQPSSVHGIIISSELFPEFDRAELRRFAEQIYRVLTPSGLTVNSFLSPHATNPRQKLLIEADSDPRWTKYPPKEWFSPSPGLVARELRRAGFLKIGIRRVPNYLRLVGEAARKTLRRWGVKQTFLSRNKLRLDEDGLETPDWIIIEGRKPATSLH